MQERDLDDGPEWPNRPEDRWDGIVLGFIGAALIGMAGGTLVGLLGWLLGWLLGLLSA